MTICTKDRARIFTSAPAVGCVLEQIQHTSAVMGFAVIAYCFMPDHLHLLVEGTTPRASFLEFMRTFKQRSAFHWKRAAGAELWQRSYYEHGLRDDESTVDVARYILANPVRAGLVITPVDYPYQGSLTMPMVDLLDSVRT